MRSPGVLPTTAAGQPVAARIRLRIVSGDTPVRDVGSVDLSRGHERRCAGIGGEAGVLRGLPRGVSLVFQAVVTAAGATVERSWPIVVR